MAPGPVSDSYAGPPDDGPFVPSWCYRNGPRMCPCGHHEGYHGEAGDLCRLARQCGCTGLPPGCVTPLEEM